MSTSNISSKSVGAGLLAAITASLCCITPVFSLLAGVGGIAATFSWMEPFRPYLIGLTILVLGFAWYQKLKPKTQEEIDCACEVDEKPTFWQSKKFLGIVTIFATLMLTFPSYSHIFYPDQNKSGLIADHDSQIKLENTLFQQATFNTIELSVKGMTCSGCEAHVINAVGKLEGIDSVKVSYKNAHALIKYDPSKVVKNQIVEAINKTGYKVINKPDEK